MAANLETAVVVIDGNSFPCARVWHLVCSSSSAGGPGGICRTDVLGYERFAAPRSRRHQIPTQRIPT